jgi:hypothetical protein
MRLFYADDNSFFLLKIIDDNISQKPGNFKIKHNYSSQDHSNKNNSSHSINDIDSKTEKAHQQVFIFNSSFQLDQVVLAMGGDVRTSMGRPIDENKIVALLNRVDEELNYKNGNHNNSDDEKIHDNDLKRLIDELKLVFQMSDYQ